MKDTQAINSIAGKIENLPTLPGIAIKLLQAVQKEEPNVSEIGETLSKDVAFTAKILKLVNSSFYSLSSKITTVDHAIKLLGLNTVKNLALSFSLITGFQKNMVKAIDYSRFWKDSLVGAIAARLLPKNIQPALCADAFFMGLLENIGLLALACCLPEQYSVVLSEVKKDGGKWHQAENQFLGFNHMEVGEYLIKSWGLVEINGKAAYCRETGSGKFYFGISFQGTPDENIQFVQHKVRANYYLKSSVKSKQS